MKSTEQSKAVIRFGSLRLVLDVVVRKAFFDVSVIYDSIVL